MSITSGLSLSTYLSWPEWGNGDIRAMRKGPPSMVPYLRSAERKPTDAMRLGSAFHCAILEGSRYASEYAHKPEGMSFATTDGKSWKAAHAGQTILTHDEWERVDGMAGAFRAKETARLSLSSAAGIEDSILVGDCKGRPDWYDSTHVTDLKITRFAEDGRIAFAAYAQGWMHQLAHYRSLLRAEGIPIETGRLVMIHPSPPHFVYCVEIKSSALDLCELENENALARIRGCAAAGVWPGTPEEWVVTDLPPSAVSSLVGMMEVDDG